MGEGEQRRGFRLIEVVVVLIVGLVLGGLAVPKLFKVEVGGRLDHCLNNLSQLGKALLNYEFTKKEFPPSSLYAKGPSGATLYEGWSWLALILPEMDYKVMYDTLEIRNGVPWIERTGGEAGTPHQKAAETVIYPYRCPSMGTKDQTYVGAMCKGIKGNSGGGTTAEWKAVNTSYKAIGGTFKESLSQSISPDNPKPPYGTAKNHPDGILFPAAQGTRMADTLDGQTYTILVAETIEPKQARWMFGTEATMAGLPSADDPAGCGVTVEFDKARGIFRPTPSQSNFKTYLAYDYDKKENYYDRTSDPQVKFGPSSPHIVVNHLFADGQVREISRGINPAIYMSLITKAGKEKLDNEVWYRVDR